MKDIDDGGVYLNVGSAVVLPEVFLKAVSVVRNLGHPLANFTTVNFDFLQHYRPKVNVVERPHARAGGHGYSITGHHEIMIPLLAAALIEREGMNPIDPSSEPVDLTPIPNPQLPIASPDPFFDYTDLFFFVGFCVPGIFIALLLVRAGSNLRAHADGHPVAAGAERLVFSGVRIPGRAVSNPL